MYTCLLSVATLLMIIGKFVALSVCLTKVHGKSSPSLDTLSKVMENLVEFRHLIKQKTQEAAHLKRNSAPQITATILTSFFQTYFIDTGEKGAWVVHRSYTYITILTPTTVAPYDTFCNNEKVLEVVEPRAIIVASRIISGADDTYM